MLARDFLTVETVWLRRIYVLFFVSLERRRIEFVASTSKPDGRWVAQQARNLLTHLADREQSFRFLLHDRDSKFSGAFDEVFHSAGTRIIRNTGRTARSRFNRQTSRPCSSAHPRSTSTNTKFSTASSTNTRQQHDRDHHPDRVFEPHGLKNQRRRLTN
jgi:hypothetical protein